MARRIALLLGALVLANGAIWALAAIFLTGATTSSTASTPSDPTLPTQKSSALGLALLAWTLGLRHAVDADHIAASTALRGCSSQGVVCRLLQACSSRSATPPSSLPCRRLSPRWQPAAYRGADSAAGAGLGVAGAAVSATFLAAVAGGKCGGTGCISRVTGWFLRVVDRPWKMYVVGLLFGLGFDTSTEIGLLGLSATQGSSRVPVWQIMIFPCLFTAGGVKSAKVGAGETGRDGEGAGGGHNGLGGLATQEEQSATAAAPADPTASAFMVVQTPDERGDGSAAEEERSERAASQSSQQSLMDARRRHFSMLLTLLSIVTAGAISVTEVMGLITDRVCPSDDDDGGDDGGDSSKSADNAGGCSANAFWAFWRTLNDHFMEMGIAIAALFAFCLVAFYVYVLVQRKQHCYLIVRPASEWGLVWPLSSRLRHQDLPNSLSQGMATSRCPQPTSSSGAVPHPPAMIAIEQPPRSRRGRVDRLHLRIITFTLIVAAAGAAGFLAASTCAQPSPSPFVFGAWLNMGEFPKDVDSPKQWNQRLGFDAAAFEMRMSIPPWTDEPIVLQPDRWDDRTDAAVFMTVCLSQSTSGNPRCGCTKQPSVAHRGRCDANGGQAAEHRGFDGAEVLLRYMPEMDGEWMRYGAKPDQFIAHWKTMGAIVRRVAPSVEIVWSPNFDFNVRGGNAFWPGPEMGFDNTPFLSKASWMGLAGNAPVTGGYISSKIEFIYQNYAVVYNKSFVLSEASYGWEEPLEGRPSFANNVTQEEAQRAYWAQVFDPVFLDAHPLFKMAFVFEYKSPGGYQSRPPASHGGRSSRYRGRQRLGYGDSNNASDPRFGFGLDVSPGRPAVQEHGRQTMPRRWGIHSPSPLLPRPAEARGSDERERRLRESFTYLVGRIYYGQRQRVAAAAINLVIDIAAAAAADAARLTHLTRLARLSSSPRRPPPPLLAPERRAFVVRRNDVYDDSGGGGSRRTEGRGDSAAAVAGFFFKKRTERLDWRMLASVQLERIQREVDIEALQEVIENITFCDVDAEDVRYVDPNFLKLYKTAQLIIEYLLHSQDYLADQRSELIADLDAVEEKLDVVTDKFERQATEISALKKENRTLRKTLYAYQLMAKVPGAPGCDVPVAATDAFTAPKVFKAPFYLDSHVKRRHPESYRPPASPPPENDAFVPQPTPLRPFPSELRSVPATTAARSTSVTDLLLQAQLQQLLAAAAATAASPPAAQPPPAQPASNTEPQATASTQQQQEPPPPAAGSETIAALTEAVEKMAARIAETERAVREEVQERMERRLKAQEATVHRQLDEERAAFLEQKEALEVMVSRKIEARSRLGTLEDDEPQPSRPSASETAIIAVKEQMEAEIAAIRNGMKDGSTSRTAQELETKLAQAMNQIAVLQEAVLDARGVSEKRDAELAAALESLKAKAGGVKSERAGSADRIDKKNPAPQGGKDSRKEDDDDVPLSAVSPKAASRPPEIKTAFVEVTPAKGQSSDGTGQNPAAPEKAAQQVDAAKKEAPVEPMEKADVEKAQQKPESGKSRAEPLDWNKCLKLLKLQSKPSASTPNPLIKSVSSHSPTAFTQMRGTIEANIQREIDARNVATAAGSEYWEATMKQQTIALTSETRIKEMNNPLFKQLKNHIEHEIQTLVATHFKPTAAPAPEPTTPKTPSEKREAASKKKVGRRLKAEKPKSDGRERLSKSLHALAHLRFAEMPPPLRARKTASPDGTESDDDSDTSESESSRSTKKSFRPSVSSSTNLDNRSSDPFRQPLPVPQSPLKVVGESLKSGLQSVMGMVGLARNSTSSLLSQHAQSTQAKPQQHKKSSRKSSSASMDKGSDDDDGEDDDESATPSASGSEDGDPRQRPARDDPPSNRGSRTRLEERDHARTKQNQQRSRERYSDSDASASDASLSDRSGSRTPSPPPRAQPPPLLPKVAATTTTATAATAVDPPRSRPDVDDPRRSAKPLLATVAVAAAPVGLRSTGTIQEESDEDDADRTRPPQRARLAPVAAAAAPRQIVVGRSRDDDDEDEDRSPRPVVRQVQTKEALSRARSPQNDGGRDDVTSVTDLSAGGRENRARRHQPSEDFEVSELSDVSDFDDWDDDRDGGGGGARARGAPQADRGQERQFLVAPPPPRTARLPQLGGAHKKSTDHHHDKDSDTGITDLLENFSDSDGSFDDRPRAGGHSSGPSKQQASAPGPRRIEAAPARQPLRAGFNEAKSGSGGGWGGGGGGKQVKNDGLAGSRRAGFDRDHDDDHHEGDFDLSDLSVIESL
ncbi:hypothetical protein DFJ73DRAFT_763505 [Zopfochytrium polystomum]|nr:hypothetical protein DFJ73DRAFT_763505 [Zopfochytrium polystomum]